ncbi:MAG: transcriptional repressor [Desulfarculaceae bacterium]|nr:transcriptional repressor [Desulfarculaceae bacterium]MCF8072368.1 transcriptional repressor [Desulfarculaceae bacterium]MCF8100289.1 transcriptional repressor [Desulfarculaceae bacterium]MCF8116138.1 transcriptional repressor [Desulfarculaceae bacterium]
MEAPGKLRMTTQRQVIMEELQSVKSHPTAGELCQMVRRRLPRISLGTVYRNLDILSRAGFIQKLDVAGQEMRFDGNTMNHYHLRCLECGRVFDVEMDLLDEVEERLARESGFEVLGHRLEFVGRCEACQGRAGSH